MNDLLSLGAVIWYQRRADRRSDLVRLLPVRISPSRLAIKPTRNRQSGISVDVMAKERKLIPAEPGQEIAWPSDRAETLSNDLQDTISEDVAVEIIDALEIVEVDQEECVPATD